MGGSRNYSMHIDQQWSRPTVSSMASMGKSCCAVSCTNRFSKGLSTHFYRFPDDPARRARWIAAVNRKDWTPNEHSWICSDHFISSEKSIDPLSPDYVPSIFKHLSSPFKRKRARDMERYERLSLTKKRKITEADKQTDVIKDCDGCATSKCAGALVETIDTLTYA